MITMRSNDNGWIKVHRKMLDNPIVFKDPDHLGVWIYLLLTATHKERPVLFGGKKITLKPGQLVTGRKVISQYTGVNESKVRRILDLFKSDHQIDQQATRYGSLITILAWDEYQLCDQQDDQQMTNKWPTSDQQVTTKQECKNNNMSKFTEEFEHLWGLYPRKEGKKKALESYKRSRKNGATFEEVEQGIKSYLDHIMASGMDRQYIKMGQTYFNGECWRDVYEEKPQPPQRKKDSLEENIAFVAKAKGMTIEEFKKVYGYD